MDPSRISASIENDDVDALIEMARHGQSDDRLLAMQALGKVGDERALAVLRETLRDPEIKMRRMAARVLYRMVADRATDVLDMRTIQHILRFRTPEEILSSATASRLFLQTLDIVPADSRTLDLEHGDGTVVSGSPMEDYRGLTFRRAGIEQDLHEAVRHMLSFFESLKGETEGWWAIGPSRGAGIIAFRKGDRYGETLHELALARIAPERYLTLTTHCYYADWD